MYRRSYWIISFDFIEKGSVHISGRKKKKVWAESPHNPLSVSSRTSMIIPKRQASTRIRICWGVRLRSSPPHCVHIGWDCSLWWVQGNLGSPRRENPSPIALFEKWLELGKWPPPAEQGPWSTLGGICVWTPVNNAMVAALYLPVLQYFLKSHRRFWWSLLTHCMMRRSLRT